MIQGGRPKAEGKVFGNLIPAFWPLGMGDTTLLTLNDLRWLVRI